ncbi:ClpXP protease specificity-enhancing factor [Idiomarina sp. M1R2S28]|jgi:stringent starvation protein B|uniref:ClpXP protease specificity-enhancing factor n=1 Tax=Idiomarina rhizosphaerae TaxID=2961572 RepID=A0A9X2G2E2_9GAMM|nr:MULTISPECIES: ClpXP protease specificity-enhancing factor [Idiomarina]MCP1338673.1 ClpXP protease specificity-enhancing factor [Idiomarina rhizosphaerae]MRJ45285.1 ClpXP protease specificity-enhancing factor [Idiomarina loihiensis]TDO48834.1 stringent starvation protein B [Idiomarina sp. 017G]UTW32250.1 ClpXP protease specificity-enhancing factor [Idiomarina loihiensis]
MTPKRPYLLRALYEWIVDNDLTPHLVVDATIVGTVVPQNFVSEGQIVLNISPTAVQGLQLADHEVRFNARFGGQPMQVIVPMTAALAIYARENGAGAMFEAEPELDKMPELDEEDKGSDDAEQKSAKKKPNLKVVK